MPTYEYACPDCGYKFELKQKFTEDAVKQCPQCSKRHVHRVVGQVAVTFKGSGWYITDSKSSSEKHTLEHKKKDLVTAEAPAGDGAKTESQTDGKGESKGETTKTESKPAAEKPAKKSKSS
jgi:putative FmdB family regulatory protein